MIVAHDDLYAQSRNIDFGPNPFNYGPSESLQHAEDTEYVPIQTPKNNHLPFLEIPQNNGGSPVEQTTEAEDDNRDIPHKKLFLMTQLQKKHKKIRKITRKMDTQKKPEKSQNTPLQENSIKTRGEKYNPNPKYCYRY